MAFDFGALPPEIISAWMYSGAGSGPLISAASAWSSLAMELEAAEASAQAVVSELCGEQWTGPGSAAMATAVAPYLAWLHSTSAAAQQAGSQAMASAAAFESARAGTVPPPVIAANRAQLAALVATNFLGQNTPAILATEAHYMAMWVQDALAMFGYSGSSASAAVLSPMTPAPQTTNPVGSAVASAGSADGLQQGLTQTLTTLQGALQSLTSPLTASSSSATTLIDAVDLFLGTPLFANAINGGVNTSAWFVCTAIPTALSLGHTLALAGPATLASDVVGAEGIAGGFAPAVLAGAAQPAGAVPFRAAPVLGGLGQASMIGGLSVPATWSTTGAAASTGALTGSGWTAAAEEGASMHAVPAGMGSMASSGRTTGLPRYGVKPTVMPKQVFV
ncbi:PPE family protein [Mycolicibacter terrae]|uniref:PPE family protein n=1 Tax=Mycolicibacter terrae TaxID=1788 RepID=A0AAD1HV68_9MYCO|nr:PPE family protein [Mycolicibacter terrae]ORW89569.1 hypothetical protein AWC28_20600 [Mycolicibacter terrae]BBX22058.1 PPE family protein [Mycolicibacter terrae]SNV81093.1 PPE family protein [Mycolicibacter terrae]